MRKEYDFSNLKGRRNPYASRLKKQVTIRMGVDIIDYFKALARKTRIPYQDLIDMCLREYVVLKKRPVLE